MNDVIFTIYEIKYKGAILKIMAGTENTIEIKKNFYRCVKPQIKTLQINFLKTLHLIF